MNTDSWNNNCECRTLDPLVLKERLESDNSLSGLYAQIIEKQPHLFSSTAVFINNAQFQSIISLINIVEKIIKFPSYQKKVLEKSLPIASLDHGTSGVLMGYDFHLSIDGAKLIEINSNAGGALLNYQLALAQHECCQDQKLNFYSSSPLNQMEKTFYDMFLNEWKKQHGNTPLKTIAIVDDNPQDQFLYAEFLLFQNLFKKFGTEAFILDPSQLKLKNNKLYFNQVPIDMVYNRLTDFYFEFEKHQELKKAYENNVVVITPAPCHHALFAKKDNLVILSDKNKLIELGIPSEMQTILLNTIPKTELVTSENANTLWNNRKELFFKPKKGFGSKATYRGDKITHKVWTEILNHEYVAQLIVPPAKRIVQTKEKKLNLKFDIRAYTFEGNILLLAARLYEGQTTNFRTEGGGFAPIFIMH